MIKGYRDQNAYFWRSRFIKHILSVFKGIHRSILDQNPGKLKIKKRNPIHSS